MFKDNDFVASLIPISVVLAGLDYVSGNPLLTVILDFLSQNGF
jgi:hypothetical protein